MKYGRVAYPLFGVVAAVIVFASVPASRYADVGVVQAVRGVATAVPQGWAFFTKDPTGAVSRVYVENGGRWVDVATAQQPIDGLRLSRFLRSVDYEIAAFDIASAEFADCASDGAVSVCAEDARVLERKATGTQPPLCGRLLIHTITPVPFAFGTRVEVMPSQVVIVDVQCS